MKKIKKVLCENTLFWLSIIGIIILWLAPLSGVIISTIYQAKIQQEMFGYYLAFRHIWGLYDLWLLTLLGYIPLVVWYDRV